MEKIEELYAPEMKRIKEKEQEFYKENERLDGISLSRKLQEDIDEQKDRIH